MCVCLVFFFFECWLSSVNILVQVCALASLWLCVSLYLYMCMYISLCCRGVWVCLISEPVAVVAVQDNKKKKRPFPWLCREQECCGHQSDAHFTVRLLTAAFIDGEKVLTPVASCHRAIVSSGWWGTEKKKALKLGETFFKRGKSASRVWVHALVSDSGCLLAGGSRPKCLVVH